MSCKKCSCGIPRKNYNKINFCMLKSYLEDVKGWKNIVDPNCRKDNIFNRFYENKNDFNFISVYVRNKDEKDKEK